MKKIIYIAFSLTFIYSCNLSKKRNSNKDLVPQLIIQENYLPAKDNTPFTILNASIKKDFLTLTVQYGGGCKEHFFKIYSSGIYQKQSNPKLTIYLEHNFNEDFCKKLVVDTLVFNISDGRYEGRDKRQKVEIEIDSYPTILEYNY